MRTLTNNGPLWYLAEVIIRRRWLAAPRGRSTSSAQGKKRGTMPRHSGFRGHRCSLVGEPSAILREAPGKHVCTQYMFDPICSYI